MIEEDYSLKKSSRSTADHITRRTFKIQEHCRNYSSFLDTHAVDERKRSRALDYIKVAAHARIIYCPRDQILIN